MPSGIYEDWVWFSSGYPDRFVLENGAWRRINMNDTAELQINPEYANATHEMAAEGAIAARAIERIRREDEALMRQQARRNRRGDIPDPFAGGAAEPDRNETRWPEDFAATVGTVAGELGTIGTGPWATTLTGTDHPVQLFTEGQMRWIRQYVQRQIEEMSIRLSREIRSWVDARNPVTTANINTAGAVTGRWPTGRIEPVFPDPPEPPTVERELVVTGRAPV